MDHCRALLPLDTAVISSTASFCPSPCLSLDIFENPEAAIKEPIKEVSRCNREKQWRKKQVIYFYILLCLCFLFLLILPMNCHRIMGGAKAHPLKAHLDGNGEGTEVTIFFFQ